MKQKTYLAFLIGVWVLLLVPFAGMSFWATDETTEKTELARFPALAGENGWNWEFLSELGGYFEDHFAFRPQMVTANALLRGKLLKDSATDQVIVGADDWMYFGGTLEDYQGQNLLSRREMYDVVHNLVLMKDYVERQGSRFLLAVVPNKNTLYGEAMPYYYRRGDASNLANLNERLEAGGIPYVDLYGTFAGEEEVLYFRRDSHWNNRGALLAYNAMMEKLGREHETYLNVPYEVRAEHVGDLDEMLYPMAVEKEDDYFYGKEKSFVYANEVEDNMTPWIETENPEKPGSILMYRDSFGESLLPFVADEFGKGYFSRLIPYNLAQTAQYQPEVVLVEKVERKLAEFATEIPIMENPSGENIFAPEAETDSTLTVEKQGSYLMAKGEIDEKFMREGTEIFVSVRDNRTMETKTYLAFYTLTKDGDGNGWQIWVGGNSIPSDDLHLAVITVNDGTAMAVASKDIKWER